VCESVWCTPEEPGRGSTGDGAPFPPRPARLAVSGGASDAPGAPRGPLHAFAHRFVGADGAWARPFDNLILAFIALSLLSVGLEAALELPAWALRPLQVAETVVVLVFSFEYVLRLIDAERKIAFVFSFYGIVDLLAIAPYFLAGVDARYLRALRVLRMLRVLKLQRRVLEATVVERTRELAEKHAALVATQATLNAELEAARALQLAILPATFPAREGCEGAARMIPATTMGGDFYDFIELADGRIGLVMADVSGKGVAAAFFMAVARTNLRERALRHSDPGACLADVNGALCAQNPMDLFVTVFYAILDPGNGRLCYANGGHNRPYVRRASGGIEVLGGAGGLALGVLPGEPFPTHAFALSEGDRLVLYTDGVTEAFNRGAEAYGDERLRAELNVGPDGAPQALLERICASVASFADGAAQSDDITLAVLSWRRGQVEVEAIRARTGAQTERFA
jgi:serine phosphatase RsbU (regulator of sigma subunit)